MNLRHLSDDQLETNTARIAQEEREAFTKLLHHLREIERRRLYCKHKIGCLTDYVMEKLKYSQDQAARRILAMKLLRDVPQIEEKISSGALNLTNMVLAQALFSKEKRSGKVYSAEQKAEVLVQLENQTTRAAQKIVCTINPEMKFKKNELNYENVEDETLRAKLLQLKGLFAHTDPNLDMNSLLHKICDIVIAEKQKTPAAPRKNSQAEIDRQVWKRDNHKCTNCQSTYAVQIDHIIPRAAGGGSTLENQHLLCRACNQRAAIEYFGDKKMSKYLRAPVSAYFGNMKTEKPLASELQIFRNNKGKYLKIANIFGDEKVSKYLRAENFV